MIIGNVFYLNMRNRSPKRQMSILIMMHIRSKLYTLPLHRFWTLLLATFLILAACGERVTYPIKLVHIAAPTLPGGVIRLSVAHVVNSRFERFSEAQMVEFLDALKSASEKQFGRRLEFDRVETFSIEEYFKAVPASKIAWRKQMIYDFKKRTGDRGALEASYERAIGSQTTPAKDWATYAAREIGLAKVDTDPSAWKIRLADTHLHRFASLAGMMAADGSPVIDRSPYNEWMYWTALGERDQPHDVVITNQLVASAEYWSVDIHSALRGGLSVGTTQFAKNANFGTHFWWSTFAYTSNDPVIVRMRGGERYEPLEAARLAGAGAVHELGHLLFHYEHPFGIPACVMSPTPMLRFREWVSKFDAAVCFAANAPGMKPGTAKIVRPIYANEANRK